MNLSYIPPVSTDPAFNLALEEYVFEALPRDRSYFLLWRNDNAVIVGRYQNTAEEINPAYVREHGIKVVRRLSGGGAVYHDLGNLNFTIITDAGGEDSMDLLAFSAPVVKALRNLKVDAVLSGRNDMTIQGRKFSGNSRYIKENRVMHHGTILFDSNLDILGKALNVKEQKIISKGIKSVRSRVTNVCDFLEQKVSLPTFWEQLLAEVFQHNPVPTYELSRADFANIDAICKSKYDTWEWNYGKSPEYSIMHSSYVDGCGWVEIGLNVEHGYIQSAKLNGDFFSLRDPDELVRQFVHLQAKDTAFQNLFSQVDVSQYIIGLTNDMLLHILMGETGLTKTLS